MPGNPLMQSNVKIIAAVLFLVVAGAIAWRALAPAERVTRQNALGHRELATQVLAEHLAATLPGAQALVLSNPFVQRSSPPPQVRAFEAAGVAGLKKGWGEKVRLLAIAYPDLKPAALENPGALVLDPHTTTPLSFLTAEGAWDTLCRTHSNVDVLVSLIGLPLGVQNLECWRNPKPRFALLLPDLRMVGDAPAVKQAFRQGKLLAVVLNRPGAPPEDAPPERDYQAEFARRFLLLTEENLDQILQLYPQVF